MNNHKKIANENIIRINIDESLQADGFDIESSFFAEQLGQAREITERLLEAIEERKKKERPYYFHEAISVFGSRGIGKTSFMLSVKNLLKEKDNGNNLLFLPMIDPSLMGETEYFLVTLISMICKEVEEAVQSSSCHSSGNDDREKELDRWHKALRKLAQHLVALDGNAYTKFIQSTLDSPELFAQQVLRTGRSGKQLGKSFHEFVSASLDILRIRRPDLKAFVVMLDDVDTALEKGWPVLETMRKFLTSPELIVMASGDPDLYDLVLRMRTMDLAKDLPLQHEEKMVPEEDMNTLREFEKQYQVKVFPLGNRIFLSTPFQVCVINESKKKIMVAKTKTDEPVLLDDLFDIYCKILFKMPGKGPGDSLNPKNQLTQLFPLSTRELIQLINLGFWPIHEAYEKGKEVLSKKDIHSAVIALLDLYYSYIKLWVMEPSSLHQAGHKTVERELFLALIGPWRKGKPQDGLRDFYRFQPRYDNEPDANRALLAIQVPLNEAYGQDISRVMDYWFLMADMYLQCERLTRLDNEPLNAYLAHLHYDSGEQLPDLCSRRIAWEHRTDKESKDQINAKGSGKIGASLKGPGFLRLMPQIPLSKKERESYPSMVDWNLFQRKADDYSRLVVNMFSCNVQGGRRYVYGSFHRGIAAIGMILKDLASGNKAKAREALLDWIQHRLYPTREAEEIQPFADDVGWYEAYTERDVIDKTLSLLEKWSLKLNTVNSKDIPPTSVLAAMWRRFSFNLEAQQTTPLKEWSMGKMLRLASYALLNAILVEEIRWKMSSKSLPKDKSIDTRHVITTGETFEKNIKNINKSGDWECPFFRFWAACPLLFQFIEKDITEILKGKVIQPDIFPWSPDNWWIQYSFESSSISFFDVLCLLGP